MAPDDDSDLMSRLREGETRALDMLMDRWQVPLRRFIYRYLHNESDASDLAQETFVRVYQHRAKFRPQAKFSTWMFSIALNLCRDHSRRGKVRRAFVLDESAGAAAGAMVEAGDNAPDTDLLRAETVRAVQMAVRELPDPLRTAILLCEYEDFPHADAAAIMGCSAKAVETRLYRARQLLRDVLQAEMV